MEAGKKAVCVLKLLTRLRFKCRKTVSKASGSLAVTFSETGRQSRRTRCLPGAFPRMLLRKAWAGLVVLWMITAPAAWAEKGGKRFWHEPASNVLVGPFGEGGNVSVVEIADSDGVIEIRFAADPCGGTEALWFYFQVQAPAGREVRLILTNPDTLLGGGGDWSGVNPVVRFSDESGNWGPWRRVGGAITRVLPDGRREASWSLRTESKVMEFAFCYPYGAGELGETLKACRGYWKMDQIGVSSGGEPIMRLSNSYGSPSRQVPAVFLMARQHSGETPGSWVLDGLLRAAAEEIRPEDIIFWVVPLANVDGVVRGAYGKDPHPIDLNRDWTSPLPMRYETSVIRRDIERLSQRGRLVAAIDFHAPGACESAGAYFQVLKPHDTQAQAIKEFVGKLLPHLPAELMAKDPFRVAGYASRWNERGTLGSYLWDRYQIPAPALETPYSRVGQKVLEIDDYRRLGASLARAIKQYVAGLAEEKSAR